MLFGDNAVLLPTKDGNVVQGFAYEIPKEAQWKRLGHYEGGHWRPIKCDITVSANGPIPSGGRVAGKVFHLQPLRSESIEARIVVGGLGRRENEIDVPR